MNNIYLDYAAATPLDDRVFEVMSPYLSDKFYNPSATYTAAKQVKKALESARASVAAILGVKSPEIIFTAGGTEANNIALVGVLRAYPGTHIVTSALEHDSVRAPALALASNGWSHSEILPQVDGRLDAKKIAEAVTDKTVLVSIMYANNEIGSVQPLKQIAAELELIRKARRQDKNSLPLYFHTDAAQAPNYLDLHVNRLGVDLMTLNGGKIYGPKQSGILYVDSSVRLLPILYGGGQERGLRSGTENLASCIGFAKALEMAQELRFGESARLQKLQLLFISLINSKLRNVTVNGSLKFRLPNNLHITLPGQDNERLLFAMDERGIQCAAGSACNASHEESSHVLKALGLTDKQARASLRFSCGRQTTAKNIQDTVQVLSEIVA
ncbi:MAG: cysteine desulfurase family protein [Patescibacteria group bacterium]